VTDPDELLDAEEDDSTAIVNLAGLRGPSARPGQLSYLLVRVHGEEIGQIVSLGTEELSIGRHPSSRLMLNDAGISRHHARILWENGGHVLEDLGSANGTYVGQERVARHALSDGDVVQFGPTVLYRYAVTDADQQAMLQHLYQASVTDALTGAHNREYFDSRLSSEVAYARRHQAELSLLMLDLDHFKHVNDTFGHQVGDLVLVELSRTVRGRLRVEDVFCRYGGEEFVVILRSTDLAAAACVGERVREAVEQMTVMDGDSRISVTVSVGCSSLLFVADLTPVGLVGEADRCLYAAKRGGRNRVVASEA
jgi:two-component system, cell cycle response regulator